MIQFLLKILFVVLVLRFFASIFGLLRGDRAKKQSFKANPTPDRVKNPDIEDLTPYDIEDADYEELPNKER